MRLEAADKITNSVLDMKTCNLIKGLAAMLVATWAAVVAHAEPVRIFAAASLQGPLDAVAELWPGDTVISYGGSGTMARQLAWGAPADIAILANAVWASWLSDQDLTDQEPVDLLANRLVLISPAGGQKFTANAETIPARLENGRMAMGLRDSVPAGIYAQQWLRRIGAWDTLAPQLAEVENVRAALTLVTRNEAPLGIVYATDAIAAGDRVTVVFDVPTDAHDPIRYPAIPLTDAGAAFLDHLKSHAHVFYDAGFGPP